MTTIASALIQWVSAHPERVNDRAGRARPASSAWSWVASTVMARSLQQRSCAELSVKLIVLHHRTRCLTEPPLTLRAFDAAADATMPQGASGCTFAPGHGNAMMTRRPCPRAGTGNFFEDFRLGQVHRARHPAHHHARATSRSTTACSVRALRCSPRMRLRRRSAIRARRSTTSSCSTWCSARPCRTSRSMRSPISATPPAGSWRRSIPATPSTP